MAVCNTFKKLSKETGTFLTFSQYMEDLTQWKTESKFHKVVPSKFIAIDCKPINYTNLTLPKIFQEYFENACACYRNYIYPSIADDLDGIMLDHWTPEYSKTLFWNMMFESGLLTLTKPNNTEDDASKTFINEIKYVGDINLQSYNDVDGMGYSEIYCHIPNEAPSYLYSLNEENRDENIQYTISRNLGEIIEGFQEGELDGWEIITTNPRYDYKLDKTYTFSWDDKSIATIKSLDKSFNVNMIIVLYDIWNDNNIAYSGIPLGVYITGLIDNESVIQNSITKYVANEDIYNSGTSYGLRICSRYAISEGTDNYIVKEVTVEDNNYGDLSRVLAQLSISQSKMDEVVNKTYNTEQNYRNLLAIFKNSRTNVPYIKIVNNESCWFVNGKLIGPSVVDGVYDSYTNNEMDYLLDSKLSQSFQVIASAQDQNGRYIFDKDQSKEIILKWDTYYEGKKVRPNYWGISRDGDTYTEYTNVTPGQIKLGPITETTNFYFWAKYGQLEYKTTITVYFVNPIFFGEIPLEYGGVGDNNEGAYSDNSHKELEECDFYFVNGDVIKRLPRYTFNTPEKAYEITTNSKIPGHICYAYPKEYGRLRFINDNDGHLYYDSGLAGDDEKNNAFVCLERTFQPLNRKEDVEYYVYINKIPSYVYQQTLKFKKETSMSEIEDWFEDK